MALPATFAQQPLYAPLRPLLEALPANGAPPAVDWLDAQAASRGIVTGSGAPLRFVVPHGSGMEYEERAWWLGEVETRPGSWHDAFNALVWLTFPLSKAVLNRRHHEAIAAQRGAAGNAPRRGARGPVRDALTQFDECGVLVVSSDPALWAGIRAHRWKEVFWHARARVEACLRVVIFGHASYDLLRQPFIGLCGKALFLHVDDDWLRLPTAAQRADIDARLARRLGGAVEGVGGTLTTRDLQPLPLLGLPGATPDNASPLYYEDARQFRPLRLVTA